MTPAPAPIGGRWTILWPDNCERWTVTVADGHDPHDEAGWKHIPVVPVPDEAAIERGAKALYRIDSGYDLPADQALPPKFRTMALAVLRAALEPTDP